MVDLGGLRTKIGQLHVVAQSAQEIDLVVFLEVGAEQHVVELAGQVWLWIQQPLDLAARLLGELAQGAVVSVLRMAALLASLREPPVGLGPNRGRQGGHRVQEGVVRGRVGADVFLFLLGHLRGHFQEMEAVVDGREMVLPLGEAIAVSAPHP